MDYGRSEAKAAAGERFRGLWAATTTPFDEAGQLDEAGLAADMDRLTGELGVDGVFCAGVMSEFWSLSAAERHRLVAAVVAAARGKCQVIAHTGHHSVTETIELTQQAEAAGADFVVVITPYYPQADDDGLYDWFAWVCRNVNIGIWLFDTRYAGVSLSDRKSTRLNSSHLGISYAVFFLKKTKSMARQRSGVRVSPAPPRSGRSPGSA